MLTRHSANNAGYNARPLTSSPIAQINDALIIEENPNELSFNPTRHTRHMPTYLSEVSEEVLSTEIHPPQPTSNNDKCCSLHSQNGCSTLSLAPYSNLITANNHYAANYNEPSRISEHIESENTINEEGPINIINITKDSGIPKHILETSPLSCHSDNKNSYAMNPLVSENSIELIEAKKETISPKANESQTKKDKITIYESKFYELPTNNSSRECSKKDKISMQLDLSNGVKIISQKIDMLAKRKSDIVAKAKKEALMIILRKDPLKNIINQRNICGFAKANSSFGIADHSNKGVTRKVRPSSSYFTANVSVRSSPTNKEQLSIFKSKCSPPKRAGAFSSYNNRKNIISALTMVLVAGDFKIKERSNIISKIKEINVGHNIIVLLGNILGRHEYKGVYLYVSHDIISLIHSNKKVPFNITSSMTKEYYHYDSTTRCFKIIPKSTEFSIYTDAVSL